MDMTALLEKMFIFIVLMLIGYFCARTGYVGKSFAPQLSKLVTNILMVATIINSGISDDMTLTGGEIATVMLVMFTVTVICQLVGAIACRTLPLDKEHAPLFESLVGVMNSMFIAMPLLDSLFGSRAVLYCSLSCLPFHLALYTYCTARLRGSGGGKFRIKDLLSPPLCATMIALLLFFTRLRLPSAVLSLIDTVSDATMPMSMVVIGASLGSVSLLDTLKDWRLYIMCLLRLVVCPILVYLAVSHMTQDPALLVTAVIIAGAPSGVIVSVLTMQYGRDAVFTSEGILLSTVLSMFTMPAAVYLLG